MKISIHQPQYIPWLPYFTKIASSDLFVFLDTVAFQKNGVQNRNTIKTGHGPLWLTVPVHQKLGTPINDVRIVRDTWRDKHLKSLIMNYRKAPFFDRYLPDMERIYSTVWEYLAPLNMEVTRTMMRWLHIDVPVVTANELQVTGSSSELILNICRKTGATTYLSGLGGKNYLDESAFKREGIAVEYVAPKLPTQYPQLFPEVSYLPDLSALDIILNCGEGWSQFLNHEA